MGKNKAAEKKNDEAPREDLGEGIVPAEDVIILLTPEERDILAESSDSLAGTTGYRSGDPLVHRRVNTIRSVVAKYDEAFSGGDSGQ